MKNKKVTFQDWGLVDYKDAWDRQEALFAETIKLKVLQRERQAVDVAQVFIRCDRLSALEHQRIGDEHADALRARFLPADRALRLLHITHRGDDGLQLGFVFLRNALALARLRGRAIAPLKDALRPRHDFIAPDLRL